ncbi:MAG TPA: hypothetical protein P5108_02795 [Marmoricola sp.]|nr:hypothetical protein [Nocardioidaceae bacterium]MCB8993474.1 hypothetical protein [Nocardioidaceae bacterium]MCO5324918.1 hypothetical protein [Nocardioidaceae bacterium]HNM98582.1 hypothetical protein [Marmoricola sp.]HRV68354.1 hypothetical protein [Marmoricola sp.]
MRQGRRIKQPSAVSQTLTKTLITLAILAAIAGLGVWFVTTRDSAPPPLSAADKAAGIHRLQPPGDSGVDPVDITIDSTVANVWVTSIDSSGLATIALTTPAGKTSVRLTEGESANPLDLKLRLVNVQTSGAGAPYADVQITR